MLRLADHRKLNSLAARLRRARHQQFVDMLPGDRPIHILDIGGTVTFWEDIWQSIPSNISLTVVNLGPQKPRPGSPIQSISGDARALTEFGDKHFDFCFSNSVIEHVGTLLDQTAMAQEVRRVAMAYFIQTPYRYFPIEPHFHVPLWAQMPVWLRASLHRNLNLGWVRAQPEYLKARSDVEQIRLLSIREMRLLFPDAQLRLERIGGLVKSIIAIRR